MEHARDLEPAHLDTIFGHQPAPSSVQAAQQPL
jgi:hypothetical protein